MRWLLVSVLGVGGILCFVSAPLAAFYVVAMFTWTYTIDHVVPSFHPLVAIQLGLEIGTYYHLIRKSHDLRALRLYSFTVIAASLVVLIYFVAYVTPTFDDYLIELKKQRMAPQTKPVLPQQQDSEFVVFYLLKALFFSTVLYLSVVLDRPQNVVEVK